MKVRSGTLLLVLAMVGVASAQDDSHTEDEWTNNVGHSAPGEFMWEWTQNHYGYTTRYAATQAEATQLCQQFIAWVVQDMIERHSNRIEAAGYLVGNVESTLSVNVISSAPDPNRPPNRRWRVRLGYSGTNTYHYVDPDGSEE